MEMTRPTLTAFLLLLLLAPTASATHTVGGLLPARCEGTVVGCLDSVSPRVKVSSLVPDGILAEPVLDVPAADLTPDAPAAPESGTTAAETSPATGGGDRITLQDAIAMWPYAVLVLVAFLALALFVALLTSRRNRKPRETSLRDMARAERMQADIEAQIAELRAARARAA